MTNNRDRGKIDCPTNRSNAPLPREERDCDDDATGHDDSTRNQAGPGETLREQSTASGTKLATDGGQPAGPSITPVALDHDDPSSPQARLDAAIKQIDIASEDIDDPEIIVELLPALETIEDVQQALAEPEAITDGGTIQVCPECDSSQIYHIGGRNSPHDRGYRCADCDSTFETPSARERLQTSNLRRDTIASSVAAMDAEEFGELIADGGSPGGDR